MIRLKQVGEKMTINLGGRVFKTDGSGYLHMKGTRLHRIIWESQKGPIPKGFDIHHKDGNKLNNSIENLECIPHSEHLSMHMKANSEKIHAWHKTPKGRKAMGEKAKRCWEERTIHTITCQCCGNPFQAKQIDRAKYCDNKCEQRARRTRGDDLIERACVICSKPFKINKYHKTLTCGYICGSKYRTRFAKGNRKSKKILDS
jgi:hypothetical protein